MKKIVFFILVASNIFASSGKTDKNGRHYNSNYNDYHSHKNNGSIEYETPYVPGRQPYSALEKQAIKNNNQKSSSYDKKYK